MKTYRVFFRGNRQLKFEFVRTEYEVSRSNEAPTIKATYYDENGDALAGFCMQDSKEGPKVDIQNMISTSLLIDQAEFYEDAFDNSGARIVSPRTGAYNLRMREEVAELLRKKYKKKIKLVEVSD